ncbi:hypothetical protein ACLB2K_026429 [Fragaria x ananassa]
MRNEQTLIQLCNDLGSFVWADQPALFTSVLTVELELTFEKCKGLCKGCGFFGHGKNGCDKGLEIVATTRWAPVVKPGNPSFKLAADSNYGEAVQVLTLVPTVQAKTGVGSKAELGLVAVVSEETTLIAAPTKSTQIVDNDDNGLGICFGPDSSDGPELGEALELIGTFDVPDGLGSDLVMCHESGNDFFLPDDLVEASVDKPVTHLYYYKARRSEIYQIMFCLDCP